MSEILLYLSVFLISATPMLEVWIAVPGGVLAGLHPVPTAVVGFLGNFATMVPVIYAGDIIRGWWQKRRRTSSDDGNGGNAPERSPRAQRLLERYGIPGLALLGPFTVGAHAAAAFAIASGANRHVILIWFTATIALCAGLSALLAHLGLASLAAPESLNGLL